MQGQTHACVSHPTTLVDVKTTSFGLCLYIYTHNYYSGATVKVNALQLQTHTHTHSKTDGGGQEKTETVGRGLTTDVHSCSQWSDGAFQMELNRNANRESPEMKPGGVSDGGRGAERNSTVSSVCYLFLISFFKQHVGQSSCCVFCSLKPVGK